MSLYTVYRVFAVGAVGAANYFLCYNSSIRRILVRKYLKHKIDGIN